MGGIAPLLVSFGTGMLKRYNQRKRASSAAEYDQILLDDEQAHELKKLSEERDFQYQLADYKHDQTRSVEREKNQWAINDKLADFNMETDRDKKIAIQEQLDALELQKDLYIKKEALATHENTFASANNALAEANGYEVFGNGTLSFKLFQYLDKNKNPIETKKRDLAMMKDLDALGDVPGFKDIAINLKDSELQRFKTTMTHMFNSYRVSGGIYDKEKSKYTAWARIMPNAAGDGFFQNLFDTEKFPKVLGVMEAYNDSTAYIKGLSFKEAQKINKNISHVFTKASEDGTYDYILTVDELVGPNGLYPNTSLDDVMALAEITRTYNPELAEGKTGTDGNMETIYSLRERPTDLLAVRWANAYARKGMTSDGQRLSNFWNDNPEVYGPRDGYEMQQDGSKKYVGVNHEARLESLSLGVIPTLIDDVDPAFVSVLGHKNALDAQKKIVSGDSTTLSSIKSIAEQGTMSINLMNNILTTYNPSYGGNALTGGVLDLEILVEGLTAQAGLLSGIFQKGADITGKANDLYQKINTDLKLEPATRKILSTVNFDGTDYNVATALKSLDPKLQLVAQRKFFATALNYTVSMILQGGTGGKTISDNDYQIMDKAMYNGLFTSQGLNIAALEAIYKTIELPVILAQYKTDLATPNAIQNMQAAMKYERLINFDGRKYFYELVNKLKGYSEAEPQISMQKDDYFEGRVYPTQTAMPKTEYDYNGTGKTLTYFTYVSGNGSQTKMPMTKDDVKKYLKNLYSTVESKYIDFDEWTDEDKSIYQNQFQSTENEDGSIIWKDNWRGLGGVVFDNAIPDETNLN